MPDLIEKIEGVKTEKHGSPGLLQAKTWSVDQQGRMAVLPHGCLGTHMDFRAGCRLCGGFVFQELASAKLSKHSVCPSGGLGLIRYK